MTGSDIMLASDHISRRMSVAPCCAPCCDHLHMPIELQPSQCCWDLNNQHSQPTKPVPHKHQAISAALGEGPTPLATGDAAAAGAAAAAAPPPGCCFGPPMLDWEGGLNSSFLRDTLPPLACAPLALLLPPAQERSPSRRQQKRFQ
jgi:hypothetical protein